ncbi:response regulator [Geobacter hydrogenophilus]|uniref:histidine kinase n=1 Tax=Geobacter hydrogenophilus TaxID=40983 RepID=A0A9W6LAI3_9BACT|nr:response regulator [Geobacter hydrogenophilus]MBT0894534.1 response regulator [Geobacter hydrogenophilus]GLI37272.1 hypothetical protein GHYDROH2_07730 [Geobacter hydrogenophilus]
MTRILIVDDNEQNLYMLEVLLSAHGFQALSAANGAEALALAQASLPDLIISDILMPVMDGYAFCRECKKTAQLKDVPFIFYTATFTEEEDEKLALSLGADRFLLKPQEPDEMMRIVRELLAVPRPGTGLEPAEKGQEQAGHLQEYGEALFRKLEKKMADLEQANRALEHEIEGRKKAEQELQQVNRTLEERVAERTALLAAANGRLQEEVQRSRQAQDEIALLNGVLVRRTESLESLNRELEAFSSAVTHDLQAPLRSIIGYASIVREECENAVDGSVLEYIGRIERSVNRMNELIEALRGLSQASSAALHPDTVNLSTIVREIISALQEADSERRVTLVIADDVTAEADRPLITSVIDNLLNNAWKYSRQNETARIEFGALEENQEHVYFVRDNGAGFDMKYASKLFSPFQRLHRQDEFEGTGVGLATVQRIIHRHGGRIWAEAKVAEGATFYFTLGRAMRG